jgi:hypothetical protein
MQTLQQTRDWSIVSTINIRKSLIYSIAKNAKRHKNITINHLTSDVLSPGMVYAVSEKVRAIPEHTGGMRELKKHENAAGRL